MITARPNLRCEIGRFQTSGANLVLNDYLTFVKDFHKLTGLNLSAYKRPQMERRLTSLMSKYGYVNVHELLPRLATDETLLDEFLDRVTINVTEFFRNPERWVDLVRLLKNHIPASGALDIWSAACSSGEEPYTLALLLQEELKHPYKILATDLDTKMLEKAAEGHYRSSQLTHVPAALLNKYFSKNPIGNYSIDPNLKKSIQFQQHNLLSEAYPGSKDLIVCRNVLIYFTDEAKADILTKFTRSLKPNGILFLGSTEAIVHGVPELRSIAPFIYQKKA